MTDDDIMRIAHEAGITYVTVHGVASATFEWLRAFAEKVAAAEAEKHKWDIHSCGPTCERYACAARRKAVEAEREACAKVCELMYDYGWLDAKRCATEIRARGEKNEP